MDINSPNDSRSSQRQNNSSNANQSITTINLNNPSSITTNVNTNNNTSSSANVNTINGGTNSHNNLNSNNATGNALRTLQNTFVPNVSALSSVQNNVSTGNNVFGWVALLKQHCSRNFPDIF